MEDKKDNNTNDVNNLLLEKIDLLEKKVEEKDKQIDELIAFNRTLLSRKAPITDNSKETMSINAKAKLEAFITKGEK